MGNYIFTGGYENFMATFEFALTLAWYLREKTCSLSFSKQTRTWKKNYKDFMKLAFLRSPLALKYFLFTIESTFFYVLYKYVSFYRINFCNSRKEPVFPLRYSIGGRIISQRLEFEFKKFKFRIDAAAWWWCNKQLRNKKNWKIFCFYFSFFDFLVFFWSYNYGRANFAWVIQNENFENRT